MIFTEITVEFENVDDLIIFTRFNPKNNKSVPKGYELAEDLANKKGGILYAKDSELDAIKIGRLKKILENNPGMISGIILKRTDELVRIEREKIYSGLKRFIESKKSRSEFNKFMKTVLNLLESQWQKMLTSGDVVLYLSQLKFKEDKTKKTKINPFYNHVLNTAIFSIGILAHIYYVNQEKFTSEELVDVATAALLHIAGGWETSGDFIEAPIEKRTQQFIESNSKNTNILKKYNLPPNVIEAVDYYYQFQVEKTDFFEKDTPAAKYAKIITVASTFNEMISGLWEDSRTPREVVDALYVRTSNNKLPKLMVDALAKGLKFSNLFDFYHELEMLIQACHRQAGKPYPMTGFKSPILFVCEKNIMQCKEFVASAKSITIFKEIGGLKEGSYGRCEGLSKKLISFYEEHYRDIKEEVIEKVSTQSGKKQ